MALPGVRARAERGGRATPKGNGGAPSRRERWPDRLGRRAEPLRRGYHDCFGHIDAGADQAPPDALRRRLLA